MLDWITPDPKYLYVVTAFYPSCCIWCDIFSSFSHYTVFDSAAGAVVVFSYHVENHVIDLFNRLPNLICRAYI